jgi:photosystem II stability/assembly factor-like uncharacterized protein
MVSLTGGGLTTFLRLREAIWLVAALWLTLGLGNLSADVQFLGPVGDGGSVAGLVFDPSAPSTAYAATQLGVYKTTDGGLTWTVSRVGLADWGLNCLAVASQGYVYTGTTSRGVFVSTDGGTTWAPARNGLPHVGASFQTVWGLASAPRSSTTLYAATQAGVFKTSDGGSTWASLPASPAGGYNGIIAVDPNNPDTVFVATTGLFRSADGGTTWTAAGQDPGALSIAFDPGVARTLYVGTYGGVYKSTDEGASFVQASAGLTGPVHSLAADPKSPGHLVAGTPGGGAFETRDGGGSWVPSSGLSSTDVSALAFDPGVAGNVLGGTGDGFSTSSDGGRSWTRRGGGFGARPTNSIAFDPSAPSRIYAGTYGGLYRSDDAGATWTLLSGLETTLGQKPFVNRVAVDPSAPSTLYVGLMNQGLYKSIDGGARWSPASTGLNPKGSPVVNVLALVVDPSAPQRLYAGTWDGFFFTTDGGIAWIGGAPGSPYGTAGVIAINGPSAAFLGVSPPDQVIGSCAFGSLWHTGNGGASWQYQHSGCESILDIAVDSASPSVAYAATAPQFGQAFGNGVLKTVDGGAHWDSVNSGFPDDFGDPVMVWSLGIARSPSSVLYASTNHGFFRTTNAGNTWVPITSDSPVELYARTIAVSPLSAETVFVGTERGVFRITLPPVAASRRRAPPVVGPRH